MQHPCNFGSLQFETERFLLEHAASFHQKQSADRAQPFLPVLLEKIKIEPELIKLDDEEDDSSTTSSGNLEQLPKIGVNKFVTLQIVRRSQQESRYQCKVCSEQFHLLRYFKKHLTISGNQKLNKCREHYGINNDYSSAHIKSCTLENTFAKFGLTTNKEKGVQRKCKENEREIKPFNNEVEICKNQDHPKTDFEIGGKGEKHRQSFIRPNQNFAITPTANVEVAIPVLETMEMSPAAQITTCKECHLTCSSFELLCIHYTNEHNLPVVALSNLDQPNLNQKYKKPLQNNDKKKCVNCETCQHAFSSQYDLRKHTQNGPCYILHPASKHQKSVRMSDGGCCATGQIRKRKFSSRIIFKRHALAVYKNNNGAHKSQHSTKTSTAQTLTSQINGTKGHICKICKQEFSKRLHLKPHQETAHQLNSLECDICQKTFTQKRYLKMHKLVIHKGVRYTCDVCQKAFTNKQYLKIHKLGIHKGVCYTCDVCQKAFTQKQYLKIHKLRCHDGVCYTCDICQKTFGDKQYLKIHKLNIHKGVRYTCDLCQKTFAYKQYLKIHKLSIHKGVRYTCDICQKGFTSPYYVNQHRKTVHDVVVLPSGKYVQKSSVDDTILRKTSNHIPMVSDTTIHV